MSGGVEREPGWDLAQIVGALRGAQRRDERGWGGQERPSRGELVAVVHGLRAALFGGFRGFDFPCHGPVLPASRWWGDEV